ncbi:hypothetical protein Asch01_01680 [Acinetobacter schindleri]|uniref:hypothetical protein n=1 Tax=Acinetobacter TaxID=469 RepID=UPI0030A62C2D
MKVYQINYDLRKQRNYEELYNKIKAYGTWCRPLKSCWIIASDKTAAQIRDDLKQVMDNDDGLLVTRLNPEAAWSNLDDDKDNSTTDWLKQVVGKAS